jgi:hypothetical protein
MAEGQLERDAPSYRQSGSDRLAGSHFERNDITIICDRALDRTFVTSLRELFGRHEPVLVG